MVEEKSKTPKVKHGLSIPAVISLIVGAIFLLTSFSGDYVIQQTASVLYAIFFVLVAILFQFMKIAILKYMKTE